MLETMNATAPGAKMTFILLTYVHIQIFHHYYTVVYNLTEIHLYLLKLPEVKSSFKHKYITIIDLEYEEHLIIN